MRVRVLAGLAALVVALAGCTASAKESTTEPAGGPFADCSAIVSDQAVSGLPDLTLPCFHGGRPVKLSQLSGPVVLNLWASWCPPCREELPAFQALSQRTVGKVTVLGVVSHDERDSAISVAEDLGLTFPTLVDDDAKLGAELVKLKKATSALPVTLFVTGGGIVHAYQGKPLTAASLNSLVDKYLGVSA
jgi:cytochrome c biogenesis protein CcmG/thiol:disulfide interchange protein DsbE